MKTIVSFAIGFYMARQLYLTHDRKHEIMLKNRLTDFMRENGVNPNEIKEQAAEILGV